MIYEERYTVLKMNGLDSYLKLYCEDKLPTVQSFGGQVYCFSSGLIGDPGNALFQITGFPDIDSWQKAQEDLTTGREGLVESEKVRLLRPVASRPKEPMCSEDRRNCYSYRRLFINPDDLEDFVRYSETWWTPIAATDPLELVLMSGYHGPAHWEQTRLESSDGSPSLAEKTDQKLQNRGAAAVRARGKLSVRSTWVRLTRQIKF